jgi:hypothetical protein
MKSKKVKNINHTETGQKDKRAETITILVIVLFALLGLIFGYVMYQEYSGFELQEDGHYNKIENEN